MHRRFVSTAVLTAALVIVGWPSLVRADGITYRLTNNSPTGTTPLNRVLANVLPPGSINENTGTVSPLTILPGSQGFDTSQLGVAVGDGVIPAGHPGAGDPLQALALTFGNGGFAPHGILNFSLKLNNPSSPPELQLPPTETGLQLIQVSPTPTTPSTPPPTTNGEPPPAHTPEPLSVVLWSTLAGAGLLRARRLRRSGLVQA